MQGRSGSIHKISHSGYGKVDRSQWINTLIKHLVNKTVSKTKVNKLILTVTLLREQHPSLSQMLGVRRWRGLASCNEENIMRREGGFSSRNCVWESHVVITDTVGICLFISGVFIYSLVQQIFIEGLLCVRHPYIYSSHIYVCMHACCHLSCVRLFVTLWTLAHQASLSVVVSRQEYWSGLLFPPPGDLLSPGLQALSPSASALQVDSFTTEPPGKTHPCPTQSNRSWFGCEAESVLNVFSFFS